MASQIVATDLDCLEINSFVRGYHAYIDVWNPVQGEVLLVKREPTNCIDPNAVAVCKEDIVVGHVPNSVAKTLSQFLRRDFNKAFAEITGDKVNRRAGYGLEIPCIYRLYGPRVYIEKIKELVERLRSSGLLSSVS